MPRPILPEGDARTEVLQVRLTPAEKIELSEGAKAMGISIASLMRVAALAEIRQQPKGKKMRPQKS